MPANEINRLQCKDAVLNSNFNVEIPAAGPVDRLQQDGQLDEELSKASARHTTFDDEISKAWTSEEVIGPSIALQRISVALQMIAQTDATVLIVGETGTCKEVVARSLHALSHYSHLPFLHVNCELARTEQILAALTSRVPEDDRQSETACGSFHMAEEKTVYLEGIASLSFEARITVLCALRTAESESQTQSSLAPKPVRLIVSSEVDMLETSKARGFCRAVYQHLDPLLIEIPALRNRTADIPMLAQSFLDQYSRKQGNPSRELSTKAVELLQFYSWPGNLRELWHVMEKFVALREIEELTDSRQPPSRHDPLLCRQRRGVPEFAEVDECELIVTCLLQTLSLRSQRT